MLSKQFHRFVFSLPSICLSLPYSGGNVSVTFTMKFTQVWITWKSMLVLNLALENRKILGSYGVLNETGCSGEDHCK